MQLFLNKFVQIIGINTKNNFGKVKISILKQEILRSVWKQYNIYFRL